MLYELGLSACNKVMDENFFVNCSNVGITHIEISEGRLEKSFQLPYEEIARLAEKHRVKLWSFHLPFMPFNEIDISRKELQASTLKKLYALMEKAAAIGIKIFVIHASGEPINDVERKERMDCAKNSLYHLAEKAKELGGVIAVEDLPRSCLGRNSDEILELISAHKDLRVCFDTNHLLSENPIDFIRRVGDKIVTLHVSDYDTINERHWLPGEGCIDWQDLLKTLQEVGYDGVWLYELDYPCPKSIIRDRDLCCQDFADNAKALFLGEKPPRFSTSIANLGMWP